MKHMLGYHHYHRRNRITIVTSNRWKHFLDKFIYFIAMIGPIMTIPQVWTIWIGQNAAGVSWISWTTYLLTATFWLLYGIAHKEFPIILSNSIWIILDILIIVGTFTYG